MRIALKVDVDTYRGTLEGVPRLVQLLQRNDAGATFLFSLGPDHTGRAIRRAFRPGFLSKVSRTSVLSHYGLRTLLYGTLLPGPDIGRRCGGILRSVAAAGFETGIHCHDHVRWQDNVAAQSAAWTEREMKRAVERYREVFGSDAPCHGAAGWQMNPSAFALEERFGFRYCSDTRGTTPFFPIVDGRTLSCAQLPTTLPTLDELIGRDGVTPGNVAEHLLERTREPSAHGHVYTLHAELEGGRFAPQFQSLLAGWRHQGYRMVSLQKYFHGLDLDRLPHARVVQGSVPGRAGVLALQAQG